MTGLAGAAPLYSVTDAATLGAHWVAESAFIAGRRHGIYQTVCGAEVLTASLTAPERVYCKPCTRRVTER